MNECSTYISASQIPRAVAAQGQGLPMDSVFAWVQGLGSSELKVHEVDDESAKCRPFGRKGFLAFLFFP